MQLLQYLLMHRIRLIKILLLHSPLFLKRLFLMTFRKKTQLEFKYSVKNGKLKKLNLLGNQLNLDIAVKNGFILKIGKRYLPLLKEDSKFTLMIPTIGLSDSIELKVIGFFGSIKTDIPIQLRDTHLNRPELLQNKLFSKVKVKQKTSKINLNAKIDLSGHSIASNINKPKLLDGTRSIMPLVELKSIAEPSFEYQLDKLELELNQKL